MTTIAELNYALTANSQKLDAAIPAIEKLIKVLGRVERSIKRMGSAFEEQSKKVQTAARVSGQAQQQSAEKTAASLAKQETALERTRDRVLALNAALSKAGADPAVIKKNEAAFRALEAATGKAATKTDSFTLSKERLNKQLIIGKRELDALGGANTKTATQIKATEAALVRQTNSLERNRIRFLDMKNALEQTGASQAKIQRLTDTFKELEKSMKGPALGAKEFSKANNRFNENISKIRRSSNLANPALQKLEANMLRMGKSATLALGPLSGVTARLTAFVSLLGATNPVVAVTIALFIALSATMIAATRAGAGFQKEMLALRAILKATGNDARVTAEEIDKISRFVGDATLASQSGARKAAIAFANLSGITKELTQEALLAAQGLSLIGRGDIQTNARRLARVLQDPINNLKGLTESGIQFSAAEEILITRLQRSGRLLEARAEVMRKVNPLTRAALEETGGLAGAWDSLKEALTDSGVTLSVTSGSIKVLTFLVGLAEKQLRVFDTGLNFIIDSAKKAKAAIDNLFGRDTLKEITPEVDKIRSLFDEFELTQAGDAFAELKKEFLTLNTAEEKVVDQTQRLNKVLGALRVLASKSSGKEFKILNTEIDRLSLILDKVASPLDKFITGLENESKKLEENIFITAASGKAKAKLQTEQAVLDARLAAGIDILRGAGDAQNALTEEQIRAARIVEQLTHNNLALLKGQQALQMSQASDRSLEISALTLSNVDKSVETRQRELGLLRLRQKIEEEGRDIDERRLANLESAIAVEARRAGLTGIKEENKALLKNIELLDAEIAMRGLSAGAREDALKVLQEEIALNNKLDDNAENRILIEETLANKRREIDKTRTRDHFKELSQLKDRAKINQRERELLFSTSEARERNLELLAKEIELLEEFGTLNDARAQSQLKVLEGIIREEQATDKLKAVIEDFRSATVSGLDNIASAFLEGELAAKSFGEIVKGVVDDIFKAFFNRFVSNVIADVAFESIGGLFSRGESPLVSLPAAKGQAFAGGKLQRFGAGGIVNSPTMFRFAKGTGLMGEAGSEAILPLMRNSRGDLGVASTGGSGVMVNVNVQNFGEDEVEVEQSTNAGGGINIDLIIGKSVADGIKNPASPISKALRDNFGAQQTLTRRG